MPESKLACRACGQGVVAAQRFCAWCGELYPATSAEYLRESTDGLLPFADDLRPLMAEKGSLARRLEALISLREERDLTPDERGEWEQVYTRWRDVGFEITLAVDRVHPRSETDRRARGGPRPGPAIPRSPDDRRDPFWSRAP